MSDKKVIGILGGMGPLATADLFQKITLHTAASCLLYTSDAADD